jgi:hypothetical protein
MSLEDFKALETRPEPLEQEGLFCFENLAIHFDDATRELIDEEMLGRVLSEILPGIDRALGCDGPTEKIEVYSFSKREDYDGFLRNKFPDNFEDYAGSSAVFYRDPDGLEAIIVNHTPVPHDLSAHELAVLKQNNRTLEESQRISRANIYSSLAHELTHLHPFFVTHGNDSTANAWEQEEICRFIGEKTRTVYGNSAFRQQRFKEAQQALRENGNVDLERIGTDFEDSSAYKDFFYPYLDKEYGPDRLRRLWELLTHEPKHAFGDAVRETYEKDLRKLGEEFSSAMIAARSREEIENY